VGLVIMSFSEHIIIFLVVAVLTLVLRFVQLQSMTRIDIYLFVFGPLLIMSFGMLFFALIDFNRGLFYNIGKYFFIYSVIGIIAGFVWQRVLLRRF